MLGKVCSQSRVGKSVAVCYYLASMACGSTTNAHQQGKALWRCPQLVQEDGGWVRADGCGEGDPEEGREIGGIGVIECW